MNGEAHSSRRAPIVAIGAEGLTVAVDFPVTLREFVSSADGSWYGRAHSHVGSSVRLLPLDLPEQIRAGDELIFTGETLPERLANVRVGTVVDPLGREQLRIADVVGGTVEPVVGEATEENFWGLKTLGEFMRPHEGEAVVLLGTPAGGFPSLFSQIVLAQRADRLYVFCQGGYRELYRYCRSAQTAGSAEKTIILWTPPWAAPALKNLASDALALLLRDRHDPGRRLVLIDDLHSWLESLREAGESANELLLPDGYPYTARRKLAELLDLKTPPDENGASTSLVVGWRYDEGFSPLLEHPYLGRLPRFTRTGIILEERAEYLLPSDDSWGKLSPVGETWRELNRRCDSASEDVRPVLKMLTEIFGMLFVEYLPLTPQPPEAETVTFTAAHESALLELVGEIGPAGRDDVLRLRTELNLHFREAVSVRRAVFLRWLTSLRREVRR